MCSPWPASDVLLYFPYRDPANLRREPLLLLPLCNCSFEQGSKWNLGYSAFLNISLIVFIVDYVYLTWVILFFIFLNSWEAFSPPLHRSFKVALRVINKNLLRVCELGKTDTLLERESHEVETAFYTRGVLTAMKLVMGYKYPSVFREYWPGWQWNLTSCSLKHGWGNGRVFTGEQRLGTCSFLHGSQVDK